MEPPLLTPDKRRALGVQFEEARQLFRQGQFAVAQERIATLIEQDPGNLLFVEALLQNVEQLLAARPANWWTRLIGAAARELDNAFAADEHWRVLQLAPAALTAVGLKPETLAKLAKAAQRVESHDVELRYWNAALSASGEAPGAELLHQAGQGFARQGAFAAARRCWERLTELDATENVAALELLGGFAETGQREAAEAALKQVADPSAGGPSSLLLAAEDFVQRRWFDAAEAVLTQAVELAAGDWSVRERLEQLKLDRKATELAIATELAATDDSPLAAALIERTAADLNRLEIEHFNVRCQRYPEEPHWRLELGRRLAKSAMHFEAAEQLQTAAEAFERIDTAEAGREAVSAWLQRGESMQAVRQFDAALAAYERAEERAKALGKQAPDPASATEKALLKRLFGRLATLAEAMGREPLARRARQQLESLPPDDQPDDLGPDGRAQND